MDSKEIVVLLKGGGCIPIRARGETLTAITAKLFEACTKSDVGGYGTKSGEYVHWGFRVDQIAGFYVREIQPGLTERQVQAMEKMANAAAAGEDWRGDA